MTAQRRPRVVDGTQGNDLYLLTGELDVARKRAAELRADLARLADQAADLAAAPSHSPADDRAVAALRRPALPRRDANRHSGGE